MATASFSLNNMTVASDNSGGNQALLMPKLQYRFRVNFQTFGYYDSLECTKQVVDVTRPNVSFQEVTVPVYNSTIYLAGKHTWQAITCTVRDDINNNVSRAVASQLQKQLDFVEQASAATGQDYKFLMTIDILNGGNGAYEVGVIETWELYGCFLASANYQTLNYGASDPVTIQMSIRYDNAVQVADNQLLTPVLGTTYTPGGLVTGIGTGFI